MAGCHFLKISTTSYAGRRSSLWTPILTRCGCETHAPCGNMFKRNLDLPSNNGHLHIGVYHYQCTKFCVDQCTKFEVYGIKHSVTGCTHRHTSQQIPSKMPHFKKEGNNDIQFELCAEYPTTFLSFKVISDKIHSLIQIPSLYHLIFYITTPKKWSVKLYPWFNYKYIFT